jgi:acyl-CoA synthetase (AMP-forming)/AMP-acid ligase II
VDGAARGALIGPNTVATGDLGHLDDDGYLYLRGRSSDFAMVRGEKVSLASVRHAAESLPGVVRAVAAVPPAGDDALADAEEVQLDLYVDAADGARRPGRRSAQVGGLP